MRSTAAAAEPAASAAVIYAMAKPRKQKLKVFRTPIGFHDAYVAAPSRKAALETWGAGTDLFQAGIAEEVKEPGTAAKEALARPGEVVRVRRTGADVIPLRPAAAAKRKGRTGAPKPKAKPKPRPSRAALDKAEAELAKLEQRQAAERAELDKEEAALAKRRRALDDSHRKARDKAEARREAAEDRYRQALAAWAG